MDPKEFEKKYANGELDELAEELYEECERIKEGCKEKVYEDYN